MIRDKQKTLTWSFASARKARKCFKRICYYFFLLKKYFFTQLYKNEHCRIVKRRHFIVHTLSVSSKSHNSRKVGLIKLSVLSVSCQILYILGLFVVLLYWWSIIIVYNSEVTTRQYLWYYKNALDIVKWLHGIFEILYEKQVLSPYADIYARSR